MEARSPTRILIADDSPVMRRIISSFVRDIPNVEICAIARDGAEAVEAARILKPDLLILDVVMPNLNGVTVSSVVKKILPHARVILFTMYGDSVGRTLAETAGADVVLAKTQGLSALTDKVNSVLEQAS